MNFSLPTSTTVDIGGQVTNNISSLSSLIIILISLILGFFIIETLISILRPKDKIDK